MQEKKRFKRFMQQALLQQVKLQNGTHLPYFEFFWKQLYAVSLDFAQHLYKQNLFV